MKRGQLSKIGWLRYFVGGITSKRHSTENSLIEKNESWFKIMYCIGQEKKNTKCENLSSLSILISFCIFEINY